MTTPFARLAVLALAVVAGACEIPTLELRQLAADNPCFSDDDCCVVVDPCQGETFVVTADEFELALDLKSERQTEACVRCVSPPVVAECVEGLCRGRAFDPGEVSFADGQELDSCGPRGLSTNATDVNFSPVDDGVATCGDGPADLE